MALSKAPGEITKIQWPVVSGQWPVWDPRGNLVVAGVRPADHWPLTTDH